MLPPIRSTALTREETIDFPEELRLVLLAPALVRRALVP